MYSRTLLGITLCAIQPTFLLSMMEGAQTVTLSPGADVQLAVAANPENTTFIFLPGTYRFQNIYPKNGDSFIGQNNPVLSGARVLTSFTSQGNLWVAGGQSQYGRVIGACNDTHPMCNYPEDLYFDSVPILRVAKLSDVGPGTWYFDYPGQNIYFADNPAGHLVETSVTSAAFTGPAVNVSISGLTIEKYAVPAQSGVIGDQSQNWTIKNNEIRLNHGAGINLGNNDLAITNYVHHNGAKGIGGGGNNIVVQGNIVSSNSWAGYNSSWDVGGMKFSQTSNLVIRGNTVHDNMGPGIWTDTDNINTLIESNMIMNNTGGPGIQHEISYAAVIRYNTVCNNAPPHATWLWGAQILIQNSQNVQVYENTVETSSTSSGNAIGIIQQNRGSGAYGPYVAYNNFVFFNTVSGNSEVGEVNDYNYDGESFVLTSNNQFDWNTYHFTWANWWDWSWAGLITSPGLAGIQALGQEIHSVSDTLVPPSKCLAQSK